MVMLLKILSIKNVEGLISRGIGTGRTRGLGRDVALKILKSLTFFAQITQNSDQTDINECKTEQAWCNSLHVLIDFLLMSHVSFNNLAA